MWSLCLRYVGVWYCLFRCYFGCCFLVLLIVSVRGVVCLLMVMLDGLFSGGWVIVCCVVIVCVACLFICGLLIWNLVRFGCDCLCSVCCFNWCELFCLDGCFWLLDGWIGSTGFYGFCLGVLFVVYYYWFVCLDGCDYCGRLLCVIWLFGLFAGLFCV